VAEDFGRRRRTLVAMDAATSETTQDWSLPVGRRPPLIGELEERIELALVTARASEAAVMTVGAAALDAAEQARRAAELAERASLAVAKASAATASDAPARGTEEEPVVVTEVERKVGPGERSLSDFSERADRLVARLRQLQRIPLAAPAATSDAAAR
jgi:hypothetical protein